MTGSAKSDRPDSGSRLIRRPPVGVVRPIVRRALEIDEWHRRVLAYATSPLLCVHEPSFRISNCEAFTLSVWPTSAAGWRNNDLQFSAFGAYNYARWRLMLAAASHQGPLGVRACSRLMEWSAAALRIRDQLALAHYGLAFAAARKSCPEDADDATGDCASVLLWTVDRFDRSRGVRFSTYCTTSLVRLLRRRWIRAHRRSPPLQLSGDLPAPPNDSYSPHDTEAVSAALRTLTAREREVLTRRFGLGRSQRETLGAVAERLNLSKEGARVVEARALAKLRKRLGIVESES